MASIITSALDKKKAVLELTKESAQKINFIGVFMERLRDFRPLMESAHWGLFAMPLGALAELIGAVLALYDLFTAKNKNLSVVFTALLVVSKAVLINLAVLSMFIGALAAVATIAPFLFIAALGFSALYRVGLTLYYGCRALFSKDKKPRDFYEQKFKAQLLGAWSSVLLTVAIAAITGILVLNPIGMAIVSLASITTLSVLVIKGIAHFWNTRKHKEQTAEYIPLVKLPENPSMNSNAPSHELLLGKEPQKQASLADKLANFHQQTDTMVLLNLQNPTQAVKSLVEIIDKKLDSPTTKEGALRDLRENLAKISNSAQAIGQQEKQAVKKYLDDEYEKQYPNLHFAFFKTVSETTVIVDTAKKLVNQLVESDENAVKQQMQAR